MPAYANIVTNRGDQFSVNEGEITKLKDALRGDLITPEDPAYEEARRVWNGLIDKRPGLIVRCTGVADGVTTVNFARDNDLQISVRGGRPQRGRDRRIRGWYGDRSEDLVKSAYGMHYGRLRAIKAKYDPGNLFRGNFNIKP